MATDQTQLFPEQVALLSAVWEPFANGQGWPVWDYVVRQYVRLHPGSLDPGQVWSSLPVQAQVANATTNYGLIWSANRPVPLPPAPDDRVGLSISGLQALAPVDERAGIAANALSKAIATMAGWERELTPHVDHAVSQDYPLAQYLPRWLGQAGLINTPKLADGFMMVLQKEVAPVDVSRDSDQQTWSVHLRMYLSPYANVQNADDYQAVIARQRPPRQRPAAAPGLECGLALDYLSMVLSMDKRWDHGPLVQMPDLRSAGVLALDVTSGAEFDRGLSAINSLLGALSVPPVPPSELGRYGGTQPASLTRLTLWLNANMSHGPSREAAVSALGDLRHIIRLRVEKQHPGIRPQRQAAGARSHLGLPDLITNWSDAWEIVRGRMRDALTAIALEVRMNSNASEQES